MARTVIAVHCLNAEHSDRAADAALATAEERARAARFRHDADARYFLARRGATRRLVAARLGTEPAEVMVARGAFGQPYLPGSSLRISVSQSGPLTLIALADGVPLGCDVERTVPYAKLLDIARLSFTRPEYLRVAALAGHERLAAFYDCWTRKEAYLKAVGAGMSLPMNSFEFVVDASGVARLANGGAEWRSTSWSPARGYRAAVVATGDGWTLDDSAAYVELP